MPRYDDVTDIASFSAQVNAITDGFDAKAEFVWAAGVKTTSFTAVDHGLYRVGAGVTATLPAAVVGAAVRFKADTTVTGASPATIARAGTDLIFGLGLSLAGASSFALGAPEAYVDLFCFAAGSWEIVGGAQDTGWVTPTLASGFGADANQPVRWRATADRGNLEGIVQNTSGTTQGATTAIFNIPSPYRPAQNPKTFPYVSASGFFAPIIVNGNVEPQIAIGAGQEVFCNGLSYSLT